MTSVDHVYTELRAVAESFTLSDIRSYMPEFLSKYSRETIQATHDRIIGQGTERRLYEAFQIKLIFIAGMLAQHLSDHTAKKSEAMTEHRYPILGGGT